MTADNEETLVAHLDALRSTIIRCLVAVAVLFIPAFLAAPYCIDFLTGPLLSAGPLQFAIADPLLSANAKPLAEASVQFHYFHPMEVFVLQMKMAFVLSLVVAFPYVARQVWLFVLPALYERERKFIRGIVLFSSALFIGGVAFCLLVCFPMVVRFGMCFATEGIVATIGISQVVSMALWLSIAFGLMFQFPLVTFGLVKSGIVEYATVCNKRPYVLVGVLVLAAVLTPPDVVSQLVLATPTYLLFELGLLFARRYKGR